MSKHVAKFSDKHLRAGESVIAWADGYIGEMMGSGDKTQKNGVLIVTGERVAFYRKGILGETLETIPLKSITSIERRSKLGHRTVRMHTSHDHLEFKMMSDDSVLVDAIESGRTPLPVTAPAPVVHIQTDDPMTLLKKLAELKEMGVLTDAEFLEKKAALLAKV